MSFMLSVASKPFMLRVVMLNVVMLSVIILKVMAPYIDASKIYNGGIHPVNSSTVTRNWRLLLLSKLIGFIFDQNI